MGKRSRTDSSRSRRWTAQRGYEPGTFGPASRVRQIDPASYVPGDERAKGRPAPLRVMLERRADRIIAKGARGKKKRRQKVPATSGTAESIQIGMSRYRNSPDEPWRYDIGDPDQCEWLLHDAGQKLVEALPERSMSAAP